MLDKSGKVQLVKDLVNPLEIDNRDLCSPTDD